MDAVNTILATLQTAHQSWKSRGVQSRALLLLIVELDNNALLSREARDQIQTDASIYALVSHIFLSSSLLTEWWTGPATPDGQPSSGCGSRRVT